MEKDSLISRLSSETGLTPRRCKSLLERYNYDYEKTCQNEIVKSARKNHTEIAAEKPSVPQKENKKSDKKTEDKQKTETTKTENVKEIAEKPSEKPSETRKSRKSKVVQQTAEKPSERKKRGSKAILEDNNTEEPSEKEDEVKAETAASSKPHTETRTHGGLTFQVDVIAGHDYFGDKEIHSDQSGFYHPFATMKDIVEWKTKYLKKTNAFDSNKK